MLDIRSINNNFIQRLNWVEMHLWINLLFVGNGFLGNFLV